MNHGKTWKNLLSRKYDVLPKRILAVVCGQPSSSFTPINYRFYIACSGSVTDYSCLSILNDITFSMNLFFSVTGKKSVVAMSLGIGHRGPNHSDRIQWLQSYEQAKPLGKEILFFLKITSRDELHKYCSSKKGVYLFQWGKKLWHRPYALRRWRHLGRDQVPAGNHKSNPIIMCSLSSTLGCSFPYGYIAAVLLYEFYKLPRACITSLVCLWFKSGPSPCFIIHHRRTGRQMLVVWSF